MVGAAFGPRSELPLQNKSRLESRSHYQKIIAVKCLIREPDDRFKRYYLDMIVSNDIIIIMKFDITPCQITSEIVNSLAAIAESIGQLEGVNLIQPGPQLRRKNRIQTIQASLAIEGNSLTPDQVTA